MKNILKIKKNNNKEPDIKTIREEIRPEVEQRMIENGYMYQASDGSYRPKRGSCYARWAYEKEILKERYGIEWKTPAEENPGVIFD